MVEIEIKLMNFFQIVKAIYFLRDILNWEREKSSQTLEKERHGQRKKAN